MKTRALKQRNRGKRIKLAVEIDEKVLEEIHNMRNARAVINFHTVVGLVTGIVLANDRTFLKENEITVEFTVGWFPKYLQKIKLCQKKINDSESPDNSWFDERNWVFFL